MREGFTCILITVPGGTQAPTCNEAVREILFTIIDFIFELLSYLQPVRDETDCEDISRGAYRARQLASTSGKENLRSTVNDFY